MKNTKKLIGDLQERAKELRCLYEVEKALNKAEHPLAEVMMDVADAIGAGWQFPEICVASIELEGEIFESQGFMETPCALKSVISVHGEEVGTMTVCYTEDCPAGDTGPFLEEEVQLLDSLADRLGHFLLFRKMQAMGKKWRELESMPSGDGGNSWRVIIDLLKETDDSLFLRISRKMLNFLCSIGTTGAQAMLKQIDKEYDPYETGTGETNVPEERRAWDNSLLMEGAPFHLAAKHLSGEEIIFYTQKWIQEDKAASFLNVLNNPRSTLSEIQEVLRRFQQSAQDGRGLPDSTMKSVCVSLTQRVLTEQLDFVQIAKDHVGVSFFRDLMDRVIMPTESHGKVGGKAAGMMLAHNILNGGGEPDPKVASGFPEKKGPHDEVNWSLLSEIKLPGTWHIASDAILDFIAYNDLEDILHQKYKGVDEVRRDYPNIIRLFKNSLFPPNLVHGMSSALDDFDGVPIVIRSSSLLEDRVGTAFSGKYKSLFLANQGTKKECLEALLDAVAEVYASMFGPDPIEYRAERGVLEFDEQMGILIQEVVGTRNGKYFFPAFAGVAFSKNEFRWSPRITRDDGLVRLVPGLGTRAVDRTGDDFPVLIVPGQPELRVNVAIDEIVRYSPSRMDVINLENNSFETVEIDQLLKELEGCYDGLPLVFSVLKDGRLVKPVSLLLDPARERVLPTFDEVRSDRKFLPQMKGLLSVLEKTLQTPVDVEFAHDGKDLYLLQCRPQSQAELAPSQPIPQDIPVADIIFSADKHVSNGRMEDITHLVYVDPERYGELSSKTEMKAVGRAIGQLNKLLPRKKFVLLGPGRWGSRGDIKLGVSVTYADINNTAMLIEIARKKGGYVPDVSFGTHFFQDLVEAGIGYLPLYPDDEGIHFSERFLLRSDNMLAGLVPQFAALEDVVHVIDVARATEGKVVRVLLNADLDQAVACLSDPGIRREQVPVPGKQDDRQPIQYWLWRKQMAKKIASELDAARFGVKSIYLFGSVKNGTAGPASDIDLMVHFRGSDSQKSQLMSWMEGWSRCLGEVNYLKTGYKTDGLLDVHLVTDEDIHNKTSYAVKIGAVTDAALELSLSGS